MPYSYSDILDQYDRSRAFGDPRDLKTFAGDMNTRTGSQDYNEGLRDSWWTRASARLDQASQVSPLGQGFGWLGQQIAGQTGREVGQGIPRMALESIPMVASGGLAGIAATAGLGATHSYAETGSKEQAAVTGAAGLALPGAGHWLGGVGESVAGPVGRFVGSQLGMIGVGQGAQAVSSKLAGQQYNPADPHFWLQQIPFTVFDALHLAGGVKTAEPQATPVPTAESKVATPIEAPPKSAGTVVAQAQLEQLLQRTSDAAAAGQPVAVSELLKSIQDNVNRPPETQNNEKVISKNIVSAAAIKTEDGSIFTGPLHALAEDKARIAGKLKGEVVPGYVKPDGTFITSSEAYNQYGLGDSNFLQARRDFEAEPGVAIQGKASKQTNSVWKMLVTGQDEGNPDLGLAEHKNVWINSKNEPVKREDGSYTWNGPKSELGTNVTHPILADDADTNQPQLPVQPEGVEPTQPLAPDQLRHAAAMVPDIPVETLATLNSELAHEAVTLHEKAVSQEEAARSASVAPLDKAENIPVLVVADPKPVVEKELEKGATETQAVETARLQKQTPDIDEAIIQQQVSEALLRQDALENLGRQHEELKGQILELKKQQADLTQGVQTSKPSPENMQDLAQTQSQLTNVTQKLTAAQEQKRNVFAQLKAGYNREANKGPNTVAATFKGQESLSWAGALPGSPRFKNESEALEYLDNYQREHPEDKTEWEVKNRGKAEAKQGQYVISHLLGKKSVVEAGESLTPEEQAQKEQEHVESGHALSQAYEETEESELSTEDALTPAPERVDTRPQSMVQSTLRQLDVASRNPRVFAGAADIEVPDAIQLIRQAKVILPIVGGGRMDVDEINTALEKAGLEGFTGPKDLQTALKQIASGVGEIRKMSNFNLGSSVPHDQATVDAMGFSKGPRAVLEWLLAHPDVKAIGDLRFLIRDMLTALPKESDPLMTYPGHEEYDPHGGNYFTQDQGVRARINIADLPNKPEEGIRMAMNVAHEMAHHATRYLADQNTPEAEQFRKTLTKVLGSTLNSKELPQAVRDVVKGSLKERLYDKFAKGQKTWDEVEDRWKEFAGKNGQAIVNKWRDVIYGLHNEDELLAQVFSSHQMLDVVTKTQMPTMTQGGSVLNHFISAWKKLIGSPNSGSALGELLKGFDNYLGSERQYNGRDYFRDSLVNQVGVRPEALASRMQTLERLFNTGDIQHSLDGFAREQKANLLPVSYVAEGQVHPALEADLTTGTPNEVKESTKSLLAKEVSYHQNLLYRLKQDINLALEIRKEIAAGRVPGELPAVEDKLRLAAANVNAMSKGMDRQVLDIQRFSQLNNFTQEGFDQAQIGALAGKQQVLPPDPTGLEPLGRELAGLEAPKLPAMPGRNREELEGKGVGWFWRNMAMSTFTKDIVPAFKPVWDHALGAQTTMRERANDLLLHLGWNTKTNSFDGKLVDNYKQVMTSDQLSGVGSDVLQLIQQKEQKGGGWSVKDKDIAKLLGKLSPDGQEKILKVISGVQSRYAHYSTKTVPEHLANTNAIQLGTAIASADGMLPEDAKTAAIQLFAALKGFKDPTTVAAASSQLNALAAKISPDTFLKVIPLAEGLQAATDKHVAFIQSRPTYISEQRFGDHQVKMTKSDGSPYRASFKSQQAAKADVEAKEKQGYTYVDYIKRQDANVKGGGVSQEILDSMRELDTQQAALLKVYAGADPVLLAKLLPMTQRVDEYQSSMAAASPIPGGATPKRRFVAGRESINMLENDNQFYGKALNYMRHKELRMQGDLDMLHPDLQANRQVTQMAQAHIQGQVTPDNPMVRKINEAVYFKNLAMNLGVNMLHAVQSLTTGMTALIQETGAVGDSLKYTIAAQKDIIGMYAGQKLDPVKQWVIDKLVAGGGAGIISHDDFTDHDRDSFQKLARQGPVGKAFSTVQGAANSWANIFSKHNDMIGQLAGTMYGLDQGMSREDAFAFGQNIKNQGYNSAGKAGRAVGMWTALGPDGVAVPQLMTSLKTYSLSWFSMLARNWKVGFGETPAGMSSKQIQGAKKAFLYQLGAQAVMAGALGLPGVGQGMALMKQATGFDTKDWLKTHLQDFFGEDESHGGLMTMLALHGVVAAATPIDTSGRHIPDIPFIGVSSANGFKLDNLMPAPVASAADVVKGLIAAAGGKWDQIPQALPHILQGPLQLALSDGNARDKYGTYQLTPSERFIQALGLQSSRVTEAKDAAKLIADNAQVEAEQQRNLVAGVAEAVAKGDQQTAMQQLQVIHQNNPGLDMAGFTQRVASQVAQQQNPAHMFDTNNMQMPVALAQRQDRSSALQSLGIPQMPSWRGDMQAQQQDALMQANPYWTAQQDRQQALQSMPTVRRNTGLWPVGFQ